MYFKLFDTQTAANTHARQIARLQLISVKVNGTALYALISKAHLELNKLEANKIIDLLIQKECCDNARYYIRSIEIDESNQNYYKIKAENIIANYF